jgi:hypothetical protein
MKIKPRGVFESQKEIAQTRSKKRKESKRKKKKKHKINLIRRLSGKAHGPVIDNRLETCKF